MTLPWPRSVDKALFGRDATHPAPFQRNTGEYVDFVEFYAKYRKRTLATSNATQLHSQQDEEKFARTALALFKDFQAKRLLVARDKMKKDRASLPIAPFEQQLVGLVRANRVVLIAAQTGAGKSTQVPQYLLAADVAYQVRFEGTKTQNTKILFLTEGLLLRQFAQDNSLAAYNLIIVDEVHERHVTGDFLLGVLKRMLDIRQDLRIVLMSATINATLFANYFNAPVIEIPGRMFPVKVEYLPIEPEEDRNLVDERLIKDREKSGTVVSIQAKQGKMKTEPYLRILERIDQVVPAHERGDLLIFLSGMNEITLLADELRNYASFTKRWIILKLHSSLSIQEQEKVFDVAPTGLRKCILSTNIAETSVTIDGVRFIIDSGRVKEMSFDTKTRLSRLSEFWISQSSAKQRTGRAGRTGPGECFRFYTEREFNNLNEFPVPEILRTPLQPLLLQVMAYGLGDPREFDFIEKPSMGAIEGSMNSLKELGATEEVYEDARGSSGDQMVIMKDRLTALGKVLAVLPMDVVLGKMLILGSMSDVVDTMIVMAAALTVPNPFVKIPENRLDIEDKRKLLQSEYGDPFTLLNLFSDWLKVKADGRESSKNWCNRRGVEEQRLYEMVKLRTQFEEVLAQYLGREGEGDDDDRQSELDSDSDDDYKQRLEKRRLRRRHRGGNKRKRAEAVKGNVENADEEESARLKRRMFWKDPEYIKRRDQRLLLEKQKREQTSGKRRFLRFEDGDDGGEEREEGAENDTNPKNMEDLSVHHLEFSLNHDASALLAKSDSANLTKRDVNLVRLMICSGLYPHIAIADDTNAFRPHSEQVYHTKNKRFVKMLPSSVFTVKPELLHAKEVISTTAPEDQQQQETLDSIRPKQELTELLCYLELLETNKPYLTNVMRVPAVPICLLFAHRLDVNHDMTHILVDSWLHLHFKNPAKGERVLVLANWLRTAWEHVMGRRLRKVDGLAAGSREDGEEAVGDDVESEQEEELELMGTAVKAKLEDGMETDQQRETEKKELKEKNMVKKRIPSDWSDLTFLPVSMKQIRYDWEMGTTQCGESGAVAGEDFEVLSEYELSKRLGEFVDVDFQCTVDRLRMQDVPTWFGYDPFKTDTASNAFNYSQLLPSTESAISSTTAKVFKGEVQITPHLHYFVSNPSALKNQKKIKLKCVGPQVVLVERLGPEFDKDEPEAPQADGGVVEKTTDNGDVGGGMVAGCALPFLGNRKPYSCRICGQIMELTIVETLRHKKSCK
ncbi:UNVERIFIED_CONTAM: DEAH (Asp-Glu-Ala-His) box polypeptide 34 [Siphonaria sp. JEL0065]|nr:DEAH (Asp-Glu-Ala-His) box polypeptide 34 [Siphonaria sp. JEL0065]